MTVILSASVEQKLEQLAAQRGLSAEDVLSQLIDGEKSVASEQATRYQSMLDSQIDLLCRYTPDTVLTYVNQAYCEFFGKTPDELLGVSFLSLSLPGDEPVIRGRIEELTRDPSPRMREYRTQNAHGEEAYVLWVDQGIVDDDGTVVEIQAVGRDITERRQLEEQRMVAQALQMELAKERELIEMKAQMVSTLSHEFRTPLSVIQTSLDILERYLHKLTPEQIIERFDIIRSQVKSMVALMEDLLVFGRMETGRTMAEKAPVDVSALCLRLCDDLLMTDQNRHNLRFDAALGVDLFSTDSSLLERIVVNLTTNAFKYSPPHTTVNLVLQREGEMLVLQVADEGIGIPEIDQPFLFQPFFRAGNVGRTQGTGLGLSIVQQSVSLLGGTINFVSYEGVGTTFTVRLPA